MGWVLILLNLLGDSNRSWSGGRGLGGAWGGGGEGGEGRGGEGLALRSWAGRVQASQQAPRGEVMVKSREKQAGRGEASRPSQPHDHFRATKNVLLGLACKFYQASSAAGQMARTGALLAYRTVRADPLNLRTVRSVSCWAWSGDLNGTHQCLPGIPQAPHPRPPGRAAS